jgi:hypothetical protein
MEFDRSTLSDKDVSLTLFCRHNKLGFFHYMPSHHNNSTLLHHCEGKVYRGSMCSLMMDRFSHYSIPKEHFKETVCDDHNPSSLVKTFKLRCSSHLLVKTFIEKTLCMQLVQSSFMHKKFLLFV